MEYGEVFLELLLRLIQKFGQAALEFDDKIAEEGVRAAAIVESCLGPRERLLHAFEIVL